MIHTFKKWSLIESFGDGEESFTEDLEMYGKLSNFDITFPPGWNIEDGTGKITYTATLDVRRGGIEDIYFSIDKIDIELENRVYRGEDDEDGEIEVLRFSFDKNNMPDPSVELHDLPFYLRKLDLDFRQAENIDGEIDLKKVKVQLEIGHIS